MAQLVIINPYFFSNCHQHLRKRCNPTGAISLLCIFDFDFDLTCLTSVGPLYECKLITSSELRCYYPIRSSGYLLPKSYMFRSRCIFGATVSGLSLQLHPFYAPGDDSPHGGILLLLCPYVRTYVRTYVCPSLVKVFG